MKAEIKALLEKKKWKGKDLMLVIIIVGVLFAVLAIPTQSNKEEKTIQIDTDTESYSAKDYQEELEMRLEDILSQMEGVGRVKVMITLEASAKEVVEKDRSSSRE